MKLVESVNKGVKQHNAFDLSFDGVLSLNWGDIVPIVCKEMVPGDSFTCDASAFVRLSPLAAPTYGKIHGYLNYFFVPNRILLQDRLWEDFIRGGVTGDSLYTPPYFTPGNAKTYCNQLEQVISAEGSTAAQVLSATYRLRSFRKLFTYFGLPDPSNFAVNNGSHLSILPFAAYNRIYGDYYFPWGLSAEDDQTAESLYFRRLPFGVQTLNTNYYTNYPDFFRVKKACFAKDYLTTAQIRPQRGNQTYAPVYDYSDTGGSAAGQVNPDNEQVDTQNTQTNTAVSSIAIKWATQIQKYLERNNVAGSRYFEQILARFGVKIPAERLDRSEYLGGQDFYITIRDVTSTASTESATLGELAGKGFGLGQNGVSYHSVDYGFFICLLHLMPESGVVQGLPRMFMREDALDYFQPELEETGMQPIYQSEVWADYTFSRSGNNVRSTVFGYIPRYAEYKYSAPLLAGDFRITSSDSPVFDTMASMHLYRLFNQAVADGAPEDRPVLSSSWLTLDDYKQFAFNRIFQDQNNDFDHFWVSIQVKLGAIRPMLGYIEASTPFSNEDKNGKVSISPFGVRL